MGLQPVNIESDFDYKNNSAFQSWLNSEIKKNVGVNTSQSSSVINTTTQFNYKDNDEFKNWLSQHMKGQTLWCSNGECIVPANNFIKLNNGWHLSTDTDGLKFNNQNKQLYAMHKESLPGFWSHNTGYINDSFVKYNEQNPIRVVAKRNDGGEYYLGANRDNNGNVYFGTNAGIWENLYLKKGDKFW